MCAGVSVKCSAVLVSAVKSVSAATIITGKQIVIHNSVQLQVLKWNRLLTEVFSVQLAWSLVKCCSVCWSEFAAPLLHFAAPLHYKILTIAKNTPAHCLTWKDTFTCMFGRPSSGILPWSICLSAMHLSHKRDVQGTLLYRIRTKYLVCVS